MRKHLGQHEPTNEEMDAFAMSYRTAMWCRDEKYDNWLVSTRDEYLELKQWGYRCKGEISAADFGY